MSFVSGGRTSLTRAALFSVRMYSGEPGSGAGRGGGGGGAIRSAGCLRQDGGRAGGGVLLQEAKEQLHNIKTHLDSEISFHQEQIKRHEDAIRRHKKTVEEIEHK